MVSFRTRLLRRWLALLSAGLTGLSPSQAGWTDPVQGHPIIQHFPLSELGAQWQVLPILQDNLGRIIAGSNVLLVYDGVSWNSYPLPIAQQSLFSLGLASNGSILAGSVNEIGYFVPDSKNDYVYHSLTAQLPEAHRNIKRVWACAEVGGRMVFVGDSSVAAWDGTKFTVWDFPTKRRLFPVRLGDELWFTHQETGLYRLTASGPKLEYGPEALPPRAPFWLERRADGLLLGSSSGFFLAGRPDQPVCDDEVVQFLERAALTSVVRLRDGNYLLGTLNGGIGVMSPAGKMVRVLTQERGLPSNAINPLFQDRSGQIWGGLVSQGLFRIDPSGSASIFNHWSGEKTAASVSGLLDRGRDIVAATDRGVFRLVENAPGTWVFRSVSELADSYDAITSLGSEILLSKYATVESYADGAPRPIYRELSTTVSQMVPSQAVPGRVYLVENGTLAALDKAADGNWTHRVVDNPAGLIEHAQEDSLGRLWLATLREGIQWYDPATGERATVLSAPEGQSTGAAALVSTGQSLLCFVGAEGHLIDARTRRVTPLGKFPFREALAVARSEKSGRIYVGFSRQPPTGPTTHGLAVIEPGAGGATARWTEYHVPGLIQVGAPRSLLLRQEGETEVLWLGGAEGVLRLNLAELTPEPRPEPPRLTLATNAPGRAGRAGIPAYPFFGHSLSFQAHALDVNRRRQSWFQSRFVNRDSTWSTPAQSGLFEFSNLVDGDYQLEVRLVDVGGRASEPTNYAFQILPPWYRTGWAYAGYALASGLAVFGFIRVRERRHRRRAAELERTVAERTAELVKANAAKDEFLAGVSHEIRNPMNGVIGLAATLDPSRLDATNRKRLDQLRYCATHLSGLLEDILDFSRLQAGAVTLNPQTFDLPELIHSIGAITAVESAQAGIPVELAVSPAVPRFLVGDPARIRQILLNFVINALKYSGRGTVCVTVWSRQVKPEECEVTFAISDDGPGIAPEELKRLFTRFERGAAARERRVGGTGLGLSVSKNLAEKMGGRIDVESELGHGSTFSFIVTLPIDTAARPAEAPARPRVPAANTTPFRALVVDDEEYNRIAMAALLEEVGFATDFAADGVAALEVAARTRFDAIFLDVDLPKKSGLEVARELRARPDLPPDLPIVATTAFGTPEKRAQCVAAGMNGFLGKPVSIEKIRSALAAATAAQRAAAPVHPPGELTRGDPLASLRLLAQRKNVPLAREIGLYLDELATEARALESHLASRDQAEAGRSAHRLTGRFAFIRASAEEQLAREIEAAAVNELWDQAEAAWRRLAALLPELRARLISTS